MIAFEALLAAPRGAPLALLHSCGAGPAWLYDDAIAACVVPSAGAELADALEVLGAFLRRHEAHHSVGFLGYDLRHCVERQPRTIAEDFAVPAVHVTAFARRREFAEPDVPAAPPVAPATGLRAHLTRRDYEARVARVVEHIRDGDVFQVNLTQPFSGAFAGDPRALFWSLCHASPAPFAAYVEMADGTAVLSSSPEEFLMVDGAAVRTRPIKGTRPRGDAPESDSALLTELRGSAKDRAELAMIVDLMRNDLGKVAEVGSVRVGPFPEHASYAQVHHLFATVTASRRQDVDLADVLRATFPAGSITGAPKLRCMELIEELEVARRGVYTGAIGWFGPGPRMHLNVAIRTMTVRDGVVRLNVGGGVTADSEPALEYEETLHKAAGMVRALGLCERDLREPG